MLPHPQLTPPHVTKRSHFRGGPDPAPLGLRPRPAGCLLFSPRNTLAIPALSCHATPAPLIPACRVAVGIIPPQRLAVQLCELRHVPGEGSARVQDEAGQEMNQPCPIPASPSLQQSQCGGQRQWLMGRGWARREAHLFVSFPGTALRLELSLPDERVK